MASLLPSLGGLLHPLDMDGALLPPHEAKAKVSLRAVVAVILTTAGCATAAGAGHFRAVNVASLPSKMRFVYRDDSDCSPPDFECLSLREGPLPTLRPNTMLVKASASAVNHDDVQMVDPWKKMLSDKAQGYDTAGVVVAKDDGCSRFEIGDTVWSTLPPERQAGGMPGFGGMADYVLVRCELAGPTPKGLDLNITGTLATNALTALRALETAGAPWTGDTNVLLLAGTGGVGYSGVQLAKAFGATKVYTAAGHDDGVAFVESLGADVAVDYHKGEILDAAEDGSLDVILDNLGLNEEKTQLALRKLKSGGAFVSLSEPPAGGGPKEIQYFNLWANTELPLLADALVRLNQVIEDGKFKASVDASFDLEHFMDAEKRFFEGGVKTRVAVTMP